MTIGNPVPQIVDIRWFKINGLDIDVDKIITLDIFESIAFPGITGTVVMQDWTALKEIGNLTTGDLVEISFSAQGDPPLDLIYMITESYGDWAKIDMTLHAEISFGFCSPWLLRGFTQKRSRPFINKRIDEIVQTLVEECGGTINPLAFIPTKQILPRFVSPYWSPIETIRYLMTFAMDEVGNGGYCLWTEIDGDLVNFMPVENLFNGIY